MPREATHSPDRGIPSQNPSFDRASRPLKSGGPPDDTRDEVPTRLRLLVRNAPLTLAVAGFTLLAVQIVTGVGGSALATFDENWNYNLITALAALNCFLHSRGRSDRPVWIAVGVAISMWCAGDV